MVRILNKKVLRIISVSAVLILGESRSGTNPRIPWKFLRDGVASCIVDVVFA